MSERDTDVTKIIAKAAAGFIESVWVSDYYDRMAEQIILALHEAGYVIAKAAAADTTKSSTGGLA